MTAPSPQRVEAMEAEVRTRLEQVCAGWPEQQFNELLHQIVHTTLKYQYAVSKDLVYPSSALERRRTPRVNGPRG